MVVEEVRVVVFQYRANLAPLSVSSLRPESSTGSDGRMSCLVTGDVAAILLLLLLQAAVANMLDVT